MKKNKLTIGMIYLVCVSSLLMSCGTKTETTDETTIQQITEAETATVIETTEEVQVTVTETIVETEEETEELIIGEKSTGAYELLITNNMGQDIIGLSIKELSEDEYPENMLKADMILEVKNTAKLYYQAAVLMSEETETMETTSAPTETSEPVFLVFSEGSYMMQLTLADKTVVELYEFDMPDMDEVEICYEDEVGFIRYISKETKEEVDTKEIAFEAQAEMDVEIVEPRETQASVTEKKKSFATTPKQTKPAPATQAPATQAPATQAPAPTQSAPTQPAPAPAAPDVGQADDGCLGDVLIND